MRAQQSLAAAVLAFTAGALALPGSSYGSGLGAAGTPHVPRVPKRAAADKKGVFMMNRIAPATSELYVANADGTGETLLLSNSSSFDYHGAWSPDGKWVTFSTARNGDGQSDVYRVALSSSSSSSGAAVVAGAPESVVATPSFEDKLVLSPDGAQGAFVSTADGYTANVWVVDLATGAARNLTDTALTRTNVSAATSPRGHFSPAWSPDGQWLVFSSDRATAWTGHSNGSGWEHTQALSVYAVRPDGTGFRQVATNGSEYSLGTPKFSPDGKRVVFYGVAREDTYDAHSSFAAGITSWIASVDFETGGDYQEHVKQGLLMTNPQYIGNSSTIGYLVKDVDSPGINYTSSQAFVSFADEDVYYRSVTWSPDGTKILYEKQDWEPIRDEDKPLYSWDEDWEYRFTDVFPTLNLNGSRFAMTQKQLGNSSIVSYTASAEDIQLVFDSADFLDGSELGSGGGGAYQPDWSPDGEWIVFGLGSFLQGRTGAARLMRTTVNGSYYEYLTGTDYNAGFPSYNHDGTKIVFRAWSSTGPLGLKLIDLANNGSITNLTSDWDNIPHFNPDGTDRILFTRRTTCCTETASDYNIAVMNADGSNLTVVTTSGANEAHAVWNHDGSKILYGSGEYGFRDECALYDDTFQPYGQIMSMNPDGSEKTMLIDSMWEDSMPMYIENKYLAE